ncbi:MAG TPA: ROK family protein [Alphaproteobacteria bacterium]|nr:ROK family protein [Alphaproteobacteria bacterium]
MRIGIDLGGTKTEIICLHEENGKELYRQRVPSPREDYKKTIKTIAGMIELAEKTVGRKGTVGVGIPGTVSGVTGKVKNANSTWLNGQKLDKDLESALKRKVRVENDANCFALSEATDGAGQKHGVVFGVIIGTGCGAGVVINKKTLTGINGIAGEWGHNPLPLPLVKEDDNAPHYHLFDHGKDMKGIINPTYKNNGQPTYFTADDVNAEYPGPQCYCGKRGCLETWISGTGFKNDYQRVTKSNASTHDIITMAQKGDADAVAALERYADRLARGLSTVINILDPDIIILGGGMGNVKELYDLVPKLWRKYILSDTVDTKLASPFYGDSSGVRGAAWLWND